MKSILQRDPVIELAGISGSVPVAENAQITVSARKRLTQCRSGQLQSPGIVMVQGDE